MSEVVENVVVSASEWTNQDLSTLFVDEDIHFTDAQTIPDLMVELGIYKSKSQSRQAGREGDLPQGFTEFKASKKRRLWIWNPTE